MVYLCLMKSPSKIIQIEWNAKNANFCSPNEYLALCSHNPCRWGILDKQNVARNR